MLTNEAREKKAVIESFAKNYEKWPVQKTYFRLSLRPTVFEHIINLKNWFFDWSIMGATNEGSA